MTGLLPTISVHLQPDTEIAVARGPNYSVLEIGSIDYDSPSGALVRIFADEEGLRRISNVIHARLNPEATSTVDAVAYRPGAPDTYAIQSPSLTAVIAEGVEVGAVWNAGFRTEAWRWVLPSDHISPRRYPTRDAAAVALIGEAQRQTGGATTTEPGSAGQPAPDRGKGGHEVLTSPHLPADPSTTSDGAS